MLYEGTTISAGRNSRLTKFAFVVSGLREEGKWMIKPDEVRKWVEEI